MMKSSFVLLAFLCLGCSSALSAEPTVRALVPPPPMSAAGGEPATPGDEWRVEWRPDAESGRLGVRLETTHTEIDRWRLPPGTVGHIVVEDAGGALNARTEGRVLRLEAARAVTPPLSIRYTVAPTEASACAFEVTPNHALFCGEAALTVPEDDDGRERTVAIRMISEGGFYPSAASSFALGESARVAASFADIARAGFLFGDIHHARFDAPEGRDHAAWLGYFSFDPRWVAAEAAGVRTAVDRWLGVRRPAGDPPVGLLFAGIADTTQRVRIRPLHRGALIQAGPSAAWSLRARLDLARLLVQRTIGGALSVDVPGADWWFDEGFAHGVALRVLLDAGVVTREEAAAEVSTWLAHEALSARPHRSLAQLAAAARDGADEGRAAARALLASRGALYALASTGDHLQRIARRLLTVRSAQPGRVVSGRALFEASSQELGESRALSLRAALEDGALVPLRATDVHPCLAMVTQKVAAFDLGFSASPDRDRVTAVDPSGPAARAGVREGDAIAAWEHVEDDAQRPVELTLERDARTFRLAYLPRGPAREARALAASRHGACALDG